MMEKVAFKKEGKSHKEFFHESENLKLRSLA